MTQGSSTIFYASLEKMKRTVTAYPIVFILVSIFVLYYVSRSGQFQANDKLLVNVMARQRILSEYLIKDVLMTTTNTQRDAGSTRRIIDETLEAVTAGGALTINEETGEGATFSIVADEWVAETLKVQAMLVEDFTEMSIALAQLDKADPKYSMHTEELLDLNRRIHALSGDTVRLLTRYTYAKRVAQVRTEITIGLIFVIATICFAAQLRKSQQDIVRAGAELLK